MRIERTGAKVLLVVFLALGAGGALHGCGDGGGGTGGAGGAGGSGGFGGETNGGAGGSGGSDPCAGQTCTLATTGTECSAATGQCECQPDPDSCAALGGGLTCDPITLVCSPGSACPHECLHGETCNSATKQCTCQAGGCDPGYKCDATSDSCVIDEDPACPPGTEYVREPHSGTYWCLQKCDDSSDCGISYQVCFKSQDPTFPYCWTNFCGAEKADGTNPINGTFFNPCDSETGIIDTTGARKPGGTCMPYSDGQGSVPVCVRGGTVPYDGACNAGPVKARADVLCSPGSDCFILRNPPMPCTLDADCAARYGIFAPDASGGQGVVGTCINQFCTPVCKSNSECHGFGDDNCDATRGVCLKTCQDSSGCGKGESCNPTGECVPTTCTEDSACPDDDYCDWDGVCAPKGKCLQLCNSGSEGTEKDSFAGCQQDPVGQCQDESTNTVQQPYQLGLCFGHCDDAFTPGSCPDYPAGTQRFCYPDLAPVGSPSPGTCQPVAATTTGPNTACSDPYASELPNECSGEAICLGTSTGNVCAAFCQCSTEFDQTGACPGIDDCGALGGGTCRAFLTHPSSVGLCEAGP